jgi:hypothetical protein
LVLTIVIFQKCKDRERPGGFYEKFFRFEFEVVIEF